MPGSVPVSWLLLIRKTFKRGFAPKFSGTGPLSLLLEISRISRLGNSKRLEGTVPVSALPDTRNRSVMQGEGTMCGGERREQKPISTGTQRGSKRLGLPKIVQFGQFRALTQLGPSLYLRGYAPFNEIKSEVERLQVAQFSKCSWNGAGYLIAG